MPLPSPHRSLTTVALTCVILVAAATFFRGLAWGLPSRSADAWLFGDRPAWTGAEVLGLLDAPPNFGGPPPLPVRPGEGRGEGPTSPSDVRADPHPNPLPDVPGEGIGARGADVDASPVLDRSRPVVLNATDRDRAAIVQRYRLMSRQPDEFIQFKALAEMAGRTGFARLDPRLYQYGGLWVYPVGGLVRAAMLVGAIESPPAGADARAFYLDRPDAFGRFYVVARAYSAAWGVVAAVAVFALARRATTSRLLGVIAAGAFVALPVVRVAAHEAKPHLAGAALCLVAVVVASRYIDTGRRRWLLAAGALCGAAMGMVVSMALALAVLPAMVWMRMKNALPRSRGRGQGEGVVAGGAEERTRRPVTTPSPQPSPPTTGEREPSLAFSLGLALGVALLVYACTNPFVLLNAIVAPELLRSNLGNSTAMYGVRGPLAGVVETVRIAGHAMTPVGFRVALAAAVALVVWGGLRWSASRADARQIADPRHAPPSAGMVLLAAPAALVAIQFVLLAAGKPAEYARFGLVAWAAGCVAVAVAADRLRHAPARFGAVLAAALVAGALVPPIGGGRTYDAWRWEAHDETARQLDAMRALRADGLNPWRVGVMYEPAPWSAPPMNLFEQQLVLVPPRVEQFDSLDVVVWPLNLESQLVRPGVDRESLDWRANRFAVRAEDRDGGPDRWRGGW